MAFNMTTNSQTSLEYIFQSECLIQNLEEIISTEVQESGNFVNPLVDNTLLFLRKEFQIGQSRSSQAQNLSKQEILVEQVQGDCLLKHPSISNLESLFG
jgi:hypothetical protein